MAINDKEEAGELATPDLDSSRREESGDNNEGEEEGGRDRWTGSLRRRGRGGTGTESQDRQAGQLDEVVSLVRQRGEVGGRMTRMGEEVTPDPEASVFVHIYGMPSWSVAGSARGRGTFPENNNTSFGTLKETIVGSQFEITGRYEQSPVSNVQYFLVEEDAVVEL